MLQKDTIRCPNCDYTIRADSDFCIYCNTPIDHLLKEEKVNTKKEE